MDIGAPEGTAVYAAREGTVAEAGMDRVLGNYVVLNHVGGYQTVYGHLSTISVILSQEIHSGQALGTVGSSGRVTGPHLHFELRRKGNPTDPFPLLVAKSGKS
jgi:murein DD-endopeptidase MepM/ murein hydrolase activator NlpD